MKNKIFWRALIAAFCAFVLYMANLQRLSTAKLTIVEPQSSKVAQKKRQVKRPKEPKKPQAPKVASPEYATKIKVDKGSQKTLAKQIEKVMGKKNSYQVAVQDLNNSSRYARVANSSRVHHVNGTMRLFLLAALYKKEESGKLGARTAIKIKKRDCAKGEKMLQTNIDYGIAYLREAMMHGNKTAANALLRKVGRGYVNRISRRFGAKDSEIQNKFTVSPVGKTTADNLDVMMKGIYQGRVLNRQHAYLVLGAMHGKHSKLAAKINGTTYSVGDDNSGTVLVQDQGHSYCISAWSNSDKKFAQLGKTVEKWFSKHH